MLASWSWAKPQAQLKTLLANHSKGAVASSSTTSYQEWEYHGRNALSLMSAIRDLLITISTGSSDQLTNFILHGGSSNSRKTLKGLSLTFSSAWVDSPLGSWLARMALRHG